MKRLVILAIALFAVLALTTGCASSAGSGSGANTPHQAPVITPQGRAAIESVRTGLRLTLEIGLQAEYKVPIEVTSLALADLDASVIDPALNGGQFQLVNDEGVWKPVRNDLVKRSAAWLMKFGASKGFVLDEASANALAGPLVDGIANAVKALPPPTAAKTAQL